MKMVKIAMLFGFLFTLGFGSFQTLVLENSKEEVHAASNVPGSATIDRDKTADTDMNKITDKVYAFAKVFAGIVLAVAAVMLVFGGFKYVTSQGDPRQAESAKMILIAAGIGILITLSAFVILNFMINMSGGGAATSESSS